eukprot:403348337
MGTEDIKSSQDIMQLGDEKLIQEQKYLNNLVKGDLIIRYGIFMFVYYVFQMIGVYFWSGRVTNSNIKIIVAGQIIVQSLGFVVLVHVQQLLSNQQLTIISTQEETCRKSLIQVVSGIQDLQWEALQLVQFNFKIQMEDKTLYRAIFFYALYPKFTSEDKFQYQKMQSTMFFQSVFIQSQNEFTQRVTRHQRSRSSFEVNTLKQVLWKDKNLVFSLAYQGLLYFFYFGIFDMLVIYCLTVIEIQSELFYSNIYCYAALGIQFYQIYANDVNFFEKKELSKRFSIRSHKIKLIFVGITTLLCLFLLRYLSQINRMALMIIIGVLFTIFNMQMTGIMSDSNHIIEQIALNCGEDGDHVRNLSQFNSALSKIFSTLILSSFAAFNFWQLQNRNLDFMYVIVVLAISLLIALMLINCYEEKERDEEDNQGKGSVQIVEEVSNDEKVGIYT